MTRLDKPVTRETESTYGTLVVEISRAGVRTRLKGTRTWYPAMTWEQVFRNGAEKAALERRKARPTASRRRLRVGV